MKQAFGIPVTTGTIDAAAEAISMSLTNEDDTMCMYGSTIFMISITRKQNSDPGYGMLSGYLKVSMPLWRV